MKKILTPLLLFALLSANAQTDTTEIQTDSVEVQMITLPDSTAIGAPDGKLVSKEIGPSGGKIVSDDGRVELNFPEDALSANTTISIQPIVNLIPNGNGKAYQFEPSGLQFKKPVQIIFHYTDDEAGTCPPELKFMALQDHRGKWKYMGYTDWDSANKSLKGSISHFSALVDANELELNEVETSLKVRETLNLFLIIVTPPVEGAPAEDEFPILPFPPDAPDNPGRQVIWSVEGGQKYGTVLQRTNKYKATYAAPIYLPDANAKVILKIDETIIREVWQRSGRWRGVTRIPVRKNLATFTCKVRLYDEYEITVSAKGGFDLFCDAKISDESSFKLRIFPAKKPTFLGLPDNDKPVLIKQASCGNDGDLNYDVTGCVGPVNFRESQVLGYGMSYSPGGNPPEYMLEFYPIPVRLANSKGKFYGNKTRSSEDFMDIYTNVGNKIKFKANRKPQMYLAPEEGCDCEVSITIIPI